MKNLKFSQLLMFVSVIFIITMGTTLAQEESGTSKDKGIFFSTEEDFITQGPKPTDGNPIISDGDLLHSSGIVYMRNKELLKKCCKVRYDLGLDAVDVIDVKGKIVAFSTELDDPDNSFTAGDLLFTNGASLPNFSLLASFKISRHLNLGLDAVHFRGDKRAILQFIDTVRVKGRRFWLEKPRRLMEYLNEYGIDIWFSTEGTAPSPNNPGFLDGDLLSAATGSKVLKNSNALHVNVPAGIPVRGVDFGMDAATCIGRKKEESIYFSTEILYEKKPVFTDGDVLRSGNGAVMSNSTLVHPFEPKAKFLGLDALSIGGGGIALRPQITHFSDISVNDIDNSGLTTVGQRPFGMWIQIHGYIPDDVDQFRVVICKESDFPCTGMLDGIEVLAARDWHVEDDDGMSGCTADKHWFSIDADGWFDAAEYRNLRNCTPDLPLTMWNSKALPEPDQNDLYVVWLQYRRGSFEGNELGLHYIRLDNKIPESLAVKPVEGDPCDEFTSADMPMMVQGCFKDPHFSWYRLRISGGNPWGVHYYNVIYHDTSLTDNVVATGTTPPPPTMVDLHNVNVNDLPAASVDKCAYEVLLWVYDRTILGGFTPEYDFRPTYFYGWHTSVGFTFFYNIP
jgi:hypothetical protein